MYQNNPVLGADIWKSIFGLSAPPPSLQIFIDDGVHREPHPAQTNLVLHVDLLESDL